MVPEGWKATPLGTALDRVSRPVQVLPSQRYTQIGIRSHGRGLFIKEPVDGWELGDKRVFHVEANCLVLNIVFAWEQAVGKTDESHIGLIASHRFPMYRPRKGACDIEFLRYYFLTPHGKHLLGLASPGGAGRNKTLGQKEFERLAIALPALAEQKKIAEILSTWDEAIETTEKLLANAEAQKRGLMQQLLTGKRRLKGAEGGKWRPFRLDELAQINPRTERTSGKNITFLPMEAVSNNGQILARHERKVADLGSGYTVFAEGDILVAKITPCFENGKGCHATGLPSGMGFGSTEFHVLRARSRLDQRLLFHIVNSYEFRKRGEANMTGSAGQRRVPADYIKQFTLSLPEDISVREMISSVMDDAAMIETNLAVDVDLLKAEKLALMQQLLTGKRRVKV